MDAFVKRVVECPDAEQMAEVFEMAQPGWLEELEAMAFDFWDRPDVDRGEASVLLLRMATAFARCGHSPRGARLATTLADDAMASGDLERLAPALGTIGVLLMEADQTIEARRVFEEVLSVTARSGDAESRARALHNLGILEAMEKRDAQAVACFEEAFKQAWKAEDLQTAALSESFLNLVRGSPDSAGDPSTRVLAPEAPRPCPGCQGRGLVMKEDYGLVLCPDCKGACQI